MRRFLEPPQRSPLASIKDFLLDEKTIQKLRIAGQFLGIILLTAFLAYTLLSNFAPFGITTNYSLGDSKNLSDPGPKNRVQVEKIQGQIVYKQTHDLIYFTTNMPFTFDRAKVKIIFKNANPDQTISLGFQDQSTWHYDITSLDVPFLNSLNWSSIGTTVPVLYQRKKQFGSVDDFLANPPKNAFIGTYAYDDDFGASTQQLPNYKPSSEKTVIDAPLRGRQTFYLYLHNEPFHLEIEKQDLNWYEDPDPVTVSVYKDQTLVDQEIADDDGIVDDSHRTVEPEDITIDNPGPGLPENGIYKVVIDADNDTIIKKITTNLHKIVFADSLFLAGNSDVYQPVVATTSATNLYTDSLVFSASTNHAAGTQNLIVDNQIFPIQQLNNVYTITPQSTMTKITSYKNDIILTGYQGYFAFSPDEFFDPMPYHTINVNSQDDIDLVDYILTDYHKSRPIGDWQENELNFDLSTAYIKNGKLSWIIIAPHLQDNNNTILIKDIYVTFYKDPWI